MKPISATMATVATMIVTPDDHRRAAAVTVVTVDPGPQITVAIVATVAPRSHVLDFCLVRARPGQNSGERNDARKTIPSK